MFKNKNLEPLFQNLVDEPDEIDTDYDPEDGYEELDFSEA